MEKLGVYEKDKKLLNRLLLTNIYVLMEKLKSIDFEKTEVQKLISTYQSDK